MTKNQLKGWVVGARVGRLAFEWPRADIVKLLPGLSPQCRWGPPHLAQAGRHTGRQFVGADRVAR